MYYIAWHFSGIYLICHIASGKVYVGQSRDIAKRVSRHMHYRGGCKHLASAIRLYGVSAFEVLIAERVDDLSQLTAREQWWLDALQSANPEYGYNILPTAESHLGYKHTNETKMKLSVISKTRAESAEVRAKMRAAKLGCGLSEEHKSKIG